MTLKEAKTKIENKYNVYVDSFSIYRGWYLIVAYPNDIPVSKRSELLGGNLFLADPNTGEIGRASIVFDIGGMTNALKNRKPFE